MAAVTNATPLMALDAVVIDTETTGLDPANARLLEIGAVRLSAGRINERATFRTLIQPGEPSKSRLLELVSHRGRGRQMPPLATEEVDEYA